MVMNEFALDEALREAATMVGINTIQLESTEGMDGTPATVLLPGENVRADLAFFEVKGEALMWWGSSSWWAGDLADGFFDLGDPAWKRDLSQLIKALMQSWDLEMRNLH
jgi:hypothetical protein